MAENNENEELLENDEAGEQIEPADTDEQTENSEPTEEIQEVEEEFENLEQTDFENAEELEEKSEDEKGESSKKQEVDINKNAQKIIDGYSDEDVKVNPLIEKVSSYKKPILVVASIIILVIIYLVFKIIYAMTIPDFEIIDTSTQDKTENKGLPIENYVNIVGNTLYEYTQLDGSFHNKNMFITYYDDEKIQYSINAPGISDDWYNQVYEVADGEYRLLYSDYDIQHNKNILDIETEKKPIILLKEPVAVSNRWKVGIGSAEATITNEGVDVKTPLGMFRAVEVITDYKNGSYRKDYYSRTAGLVKTIYINTDGSQSEVLLSNKIPLKGGLERAMYVYYLEKGTFVTKPTLKQFDVPTNRPMKFEFEELLRTTPDENLLALISPYTKINFIEVSDDRKYVHIDFSKEFLAYTSKDKNTEIKHLKAIVNTFARYYQVHNCKITIDGEPYSSSNITLGENDTIKATFR